MPQKNCFKLTQSQPKKNITMKFQSKSWNNFHLLLLLCALVAFVQLSDAFFCLPGWHSLSAQKCFKVFEKADLSIGAAQGECKKVGAELVSIHNDAQNNVIKARTNATRTPPEEGATGTFYYLGMVLLRDTNTMCDPMKSINATWWFDGSAVDFGNAQRTAPGTGPWGTNEGIAEPNNWTGTEGCVAMKKKIDGTLAWVDISCDGSETTGYICQKPKLFSGRK